VETQCICCEIRTGFSIPEDGILHRHRSENFKFSAETSVLIRATRYNAQEDSIFHSHSHEDFKSFGVGVEKSQ
jgi:hypothetical protein